MGTGEVPSLKTDEGRFLFLRGELRVIRETVNHTKEYLDRLDTFKVDKPYCELQEAKVTNGLHDLNSRLDNLTSNIGKFLNGGLSTSVEEIVSKSMQDKTERLELEKFRSAMNRPPLVLRIKDHLLLIITVVTVLTLVGGGASWAFRWLAGKINEQARISENIDLRLIKLKDEPRYVPAPPVVIVASPDAGAIEKFSYRRRVIRAKPSK